MIAEALGLSGSVCSDIELAAPMHDIGKVGIPDGILLKNGQLEEEELSVMRSHTIMGYEILKGSPSRYLQMGATIARHHHEKYDGSGYPDGLEGALIPLPARVVAVADVFDALMSERPYKLAWPLEKAAAYIRNGSGRHFDPDCVEAFFARKDDICAIEKRLKDDRKQLSASHEPLLISGTSADGAEPS
jgi:two-component system response regulator RpfG